MKPLTPKAFVTVGVILTGPENNPELRCRANGCTLAWAVDTDGRNKLCSYHAWEDPDKWHSITESLNRGGPWLLRFKPGESPTVKDMKTRLTGRMLEL